MLRTAIFLLTAIGIMMTALPASAQSPGGFPDILDDIFGGNTGQSPYGGAPAPMQYIENIPVQVTFDSRPDLLPPEATLVLTAIAPPPANVRRAKPLVMGETRILLSRLAPPLSLVIAVPSDMARDLDYAQIDAKIIDSNGNVAFRLENTEQYAGGPPPFLELIPTGAFQVPVQTPAGNPSLPQRKPGTGGPMAPYTPPNINVIKASVELPPGAQLARGSALVLQVTENDLAGGFGPSVIHEKRVDIDQKSAPFTVKLNVPTGTDGKLEQAELVAYIEDWAGRKTFVRSQPVAIPADGSVYTRLDAILTGQDALPADADNFVITTRTIPVTGTAEFDAFKGLPAGSVLTVTLRDSLDWSKGIETTQIPLDGRSGYIDFAMSVDADRLDNVSPVPVLSAEITDANGQSLFTTRTAKERLTGKNIVRLVPTGLY